MTGLEIHGTPPVTHTVDKGQHDKFQTQFCDTSEIHLGRTQPETHLTLRGRMHGHAATAFVTLKGKSTGSEDLSRSTTQISHGLHCSEGAQKAPLLPSPPYKGRRAAGRPSFSPPQQQGIAI